MKMLRVFNLHLDYNGKTYMLNWMDEWKNDLVVLGATIQKGFNTLGTPCQILFARREGNQLQILSTWGAGNLYLQYLVEHMERMT